MATQSTDFMRRTSNTYTVPIYLHEDLARRGGWHRTTPIFGSLSQQAAKVSHMFRFEASLCQVCPIKTDLNFNGHDVYRTHRLTCVLPEPVVCSTVLF